MNRLAIAIALTAVGFLTGCAEVTPPSPPAGRVEVSVDAGEVGPKLVRLPVPTTRPDSTVLQHGHRMELPDGWYIVWAGLKAGTFRLSCEAEPFTLSSGETRRTSC